MDPKVSKYVSRSSRVVNAEIMIAKMSRHERAWAGECERRERLSIPASFKRGLKDSLYFSVGTKSRVKVTYADAKMLARLTTPVCLKHDVTCMYSFHFSALSQIPLYRLIASNSPDRAVTPPTRLPLKIE